MSRKRRKLQSQINVVPYIDVMLVLLIIFMVTAPLLNLGVEIELPESDAQPLDVQQEPLVVTVDKNGDYYLNLDGTAELVDDETLQKKVAAFIRRNPDLPVLVGVDEQVPYGMVFQLMVRLQEAGVPRVGLMSDPES